ncbi:MAG TPA: hypothetical protein VF650_01875 [Allosphingosinicella sp.]|jgi:hypothetical protein
MPRYFFHIYNDVVSHDDEGLELADPQAAVSEAHRGALSLAAEQVLRHARLALHHFIEIEDSDGAVIAKVTFGDAIAVEEQPTSLRGA